MGAEKKNQRKSKSSRRKNAGSFFAPAPIQTKRTVNTPGDTHEREADRIAAQVTGAAPPVQRMPLAVTPVTDKIQREETPAASSPDDDRTVDVITGGASLMYDQLKLQPGYKAWEKQQLDRLKLRLWDQQPASFRAGIIAHGLLSLGTLGTAFAIDPTFRTDTIDFLQDKNLLQLPRWFLPYSEYAGLSSFKYKLPAAPDAPYKFSTEFELDAYFDLMRRRWGGLPDIDLSFGIDSAYSPETGFQPFTGGKIKLVIGGGIINVSAFHNQRLPPTPQLLYDPNQGQSPTWIMRSLPSHLEEFLPMGSGVFMTVDIVRLPSLFSRPRRRSLIQRKAIPGAEEGSAVSPQSVDRFLASSRGKPLTPAVRSDMEARFGHDFSSVRVHTGYRAAASARSIDARAYTSSNNIVFGAGSYRPDTAQGKKLLAHELVHVGQQTGIVNRKENTEAALESRLKAQLREEGGFRMANATLEQSLGPLPTQSKKKAWLEQHREIRYLFLQRMPAGTVAGGYFASQLIDLPNRRAFEIVDTWYPYLYEKESLYATHRDLFDEILKTFSPFTGQSINRTARELSEKIKDRREYEDNNWNLEFDSIHRHAPTAKRKIEFYERFKQYKLFRHASRKFDPFTGLTIRAMEWLTDTNEPDQERAQQMYRFLKSLRPNRRNAFLETARFAGVLEADGDAEEYYRRKFRAQYKALPYNFNFSLLPWNWDGAPFADRVTVDHITAMGEALNYEDKATRQFGFDPGIDTGKSPSAAHPEGRSLSDADQLLQRLAQENTLGNIRRLDLLLGIGVRGRLTDRITKVLATQSTAGNIPVSALMVIQRHGFVPEENFTYRVDRAQVADHDNNLYWYLVKRTALKWDSGSVIGEQRGTFDLRAMQHTSTLLGSVGGMKFGTTAYFNDAYYYDQWLDAAVRAHRGSHTLLANLRETRGADRRGKIFASISQDKKQANIYAATLPFDGLNLFTGGKLYRSGPGVLQGLQVHLSWDKDTSESDNQISVRIDIDRLTINQLQLVDTRSTIAIGSIKARGFRFSLRQSDLNAAEGFLGLGLFKNTDFTLSTLTRLVPSALTLFPYAILTMVEEFKGPGARESKESFAELAKERFASMDASLTFKKIEVRDLYDTTQGFLDNITIAKENAAGQLVRQGFRIEATRGWWIDAEFQIKRRLERIEHEVLARKAELIGSNGAAELEALRREKKSLLRTATEKGLRHENRDAEMNRMREILKKMREIRGDIETGFARKIALEGYEREPFAILAAEQTRLSEDLQYFEEQFHADREQLEKGGAIKRFEARERLRAIAAKYKSFEVTGRLRGIHLRGGNYVRDLINDALVSFGFASPQLRGIENIDIGGVDTSFQVSGAGVAQRGDDPGLRVRNLHLPLITAPTLKLEKDGLLVEGGKPVVENVYLSVAFNFAKNPLNKDPDRPTAFFLSYLYAGKITFNGLTVQPGIGEAIVDFPANVPVEVWGFQLKDFASDAGHIDLRIRDIKAAGTYRDEQGEDRVGFGIDTTLDNDTRAGRRAAIDVLYHRASEPSERSYLTTELNVPSVYLSSLNLRSDRYVIQSLEDVRAVELSHIQAKVKVYLPEKAAGTPERNLPAEVEIEQLEIGKISAQGINIKLLDTPTTAEDGTQQKQRRVQEIQLPKEDKVAINELKVSGLRVRLDDTGPELSTLDGDANVQVGPVDLGGTTLREKNTRGTVLKAFALHRGKFSSLTLKAIERNQRAYSLVEFFQFFGYSRLEGLDAAASFSTGDASGTISIRGEKNKPISIDFVEPQDGQPGYYKIRLPIDKIKVPALRFQTGAHEIRIPKAASSRRTTYAKDVDLQMNVSVTSDANRKPVFDIYMTSLVAGELVAYGMEYHNDEKGIDVKFDPRIPFTIPHVRAGGFRFSTATGFDVFGRTGGWLNAATGPTESIVGSLDQIQATLKTGSFLAEKDAASGRSALTFDIASLGFRYDREGNIAVSLGAISGGFPNMTVERTDPDTGAKSTTEIKSYGNRGIKAQEAEIIVAADGTIDVDVTGLETGKLRLVQNTVLGAERSKTTVELGQQAIGAASTRVVHRPDGSMEITITDIRAGKIKVGLISTGAEGRSEQYIRLPDPDAITVEKVKIEIDKEGRRKIIIQKPTVKNFNLRVPNLDQPDDVIEITTDLTIDGDVELGDGSFSSLDFTDPYDAFVGKINQAPVKLSRFRLKVVDNIAVADREALSYSSEITDGQKRLVALENAMDRAYEKMVDVALSAPPRDTPSLPPGFEDAAEKYQAAREAYENQKANLILSAKRHAQGSMTKKYLDAIQGEITGRLKVFDTILPLHIATHTDGENYVHIPRYLGSRLKSLIDSIFRTTVDRSFWNSKELRAIGKGMQKWYVRFTPRGWVDKIAAGKGYEAVLEILKEMEISVGKLEDNSTLFGLNINIEGSWIVDAFTNKDTFGVGLCETKYRHPTQPNYYSLYGLVEYLNYVSPAIVTQSGLEDRAQKARILSGDVLTQREVDNMYAWDAASELIAFVQVSLDREKEYLIEQIKKNIKLEELNADVTLRPEEVINALLSEAKAGSLSFDKGSKVIEDLHVEGSYTGTGVARGKAAIGKGVEGNEHLLIPGATYLSQDKGTKVTYDELRIAPAALDYADGIYRLNAPEILLKNLALGIKKK